MSDRNPSDVTIEGRLVGNGFWVTETFQIPTERAAIRDSLYHHCRFHIFPQLVDATFLEGGEFCRHKSEFKPFFVLQETAPGEKHRGKHKIWHTVSWINAQEIVRWYDRNVLKGTATTLKIEVHIGWRDQIELLLPESLEVDPEQAWNDFYNKLWRAGRGKGKLERGNFARMVYVWTDDGKVVIDALIPAETTEQYFPGIEAVEFVPGCKMCELARDTTGQGNDFEGQGNDFEGQDNDFEGQGMDFEGQGMDFEGQGNDFEDQGMDFEDQGMDFEGQGNGFEGQGNGFEGQGNGFEGQGNDFDIVMR